MARLSLALLAAALIQMASSLPIVEGKQVPNVPSEPLTGLRTELQAGPSSKLPTELPVDFPHPHPHILQSGNPASKPAATAKRNLPVTPEWLRWLPFENINM
ncbi:hypothetical protein F5X97DRAFT_266967 [Nemania serpens]|nr:hypothetical protein F5X97DRAFT_266967 [Nemania serpens]